MYLRKLGSLLALGCYRYGEVDFFGNSEGLLYMNLK
jgi:hypothetical protein